MDPSFIRNVRNDQNVQDDSLEAGGREALWKRLTSLLDKVAAGGLDRLSDREVEDLGRLYRAAATHLALLKTFGASARRKDELNRLVARGHNVLYGRPKKGRNFAGILLGFLSFPETVRSTARYHLLAAVLLGLGGIYGYVGAARDPEWALAFIPAGDERTPYATREELLPTLLAGRPAGPAGEGMNPQAKAIFTAVLWRHNTTIALLAFFSGFLAGLPTVGILFFNGAMLGVFSRTFHAHGLASEWWAWILPHGITELLGVTLLSGGGLFIAHCIIAPGERSRTEALQDARGHVMRLLLFAFPMLLVAALIESFVRQSGLSEGGRYVFAAATALLWGVYLGFLRVPRRAVLRLRDRRTAAERAVPLPFEEEIIPAGSPGVRAPRGA